MNECDVLRLPIESAGVIQPPAGQFVQLACMTGRRNGELLVLWGREVAILQLTLATAVLAHKERLGR